MQIDLLSPAEALRDFNPLFAVALAIIYCGVEALDSSLTYSITKHQAVRSANKTLILYILLGIEVLVFVSNYLYTIPIAVGAWLGTYLVVKREKRAINK